VMRATPRTMFLPSLTGPSPGPSPWPPRGHRRWRRDAYPLRGPFSGGCSIGAGQELVAVATPAQGTASAVTGGQGHRAAQLPLPPVRRQPGLVGAGARRSGPALLLPAPLLGWRGTRLGTKDPPPSTTSRRRPRRPQRSPRIPPPPALLALGVAARRRLSAATRPVHHLIQPFEKAREPLPLEASFDTPPAGRTGSVRPEPRGHGPGCREHDPVALHARRSCTPRPRCGCRCVTCIGFCLPPHRWRAAGP
jgi:hypothetical protein